MIRKFTAAVLACSLGLAIAGCKSDDMKNDNGMKDDHSMSMSQPGNIIQVATGPGMSDVTTLVKAVQAAGLVDTLEGPGPFTVLAPTNEAFAKLPPGTLDDLLKPENKDQLRKVLLYHVIPGNHMAAEVMGMNSAKTAAGESISIHTMDGKVMVGNDKAMATIIKTDVPASNGTIHWVDTVLMP